MPKLKLKMISKCTYQKAYNQPVKHCQVHPWFVHSRQSCRFQLKIEKHCKVTKPKHFEKSLVYAYFK